MSTRADPVSKAAKQPSSVLGRSAATGRYVLAPASKLGSISLKQARTAVESLRNGKP